MAKARKSPYSAHEWRKVFGSVAKWCARNKSPGERMADCIKRALAEFKAGRVKVPA